MNPLVSRRDWFRHAGAGFAGLALLDLLSRDGFFSLADAQAARQPHFPAKAKHAVFLFMNGAPSHVDTFDYKPALTKFHGTAYRGEASVGSNGRPIGHLMQTPFTFSKHGLSGLEISSLFPYTSQYADDLCVIRSLYTDTA